MQSIFISYRREDSEGQAGRLYDDLAARFGEDRVFMDVSGIGAGSDFRKVIEDRVARCAVVLVVIGKRWLDARDAAGKRRLDDAADFVRLETVSALRRDGVTVIPVLIGGATMPESKDLPADLEPLAFRNAAPLSHLRWSSDLEVLAAELRRVLNIADDAEPLKPSARLLAETSRRQGRLSMGAMVGGLAVVVAGSVGGWVAYDQFSDVRVAEREAQRLEIEARKAEALAKLESAKRIEAEEKARQAQLVADQKRAEAESAASAAAEAKRAAEEAERKLADASAAEKARAEEEATRLVQAQEAARKEAEAKAEAARQEVAAAEQAQKDAAEKASRYQVAQADLVRQAALVTQVNQRVARAGGTKFAQEVNVAAAAPVAAAARPAPGSTTLNWRLKVRCGEREVAVSGPAVFSIERNGEGVVVTERFTGSGEGFEVLVTGRASFDRPQPSYEIPTIGEWKGQRTFSSQGIDRANTRDGAGLAVVSGNVLKFRANCPG